MLDHDYLYYRPLEQNDVVVILGATNGDFIREYKNEILQKNIFVVNVEPTLEGVFHLSDYIKRNMPENACVLSFALSNKSSVTYMDIRDNLITSTLETRPETNERWPMRLLYKQKTPVLHINGILQMLDYKVDKIFADIEGSELEVLKPSQLACDIPYISIAAYHVRDDKQTWELLKPQFEEEGYSISITDNCSRNKGEVVLFAMKEG